MAIIDQSVISNVTIHGSIYSRIYFWGRVAEGYEVPRGVGGACPPENVLKQMCTEM